jgi:hypothetical protein
LLAGITGATDCASQRRVSVPPRAAGYSCSDQLKNRVETAVFHLINLGLTRVMIASISTAMIINPPLMMFM